VEQKSFLQRVTCGLGETPFEEAEAWHERLGPYGADGSGGAPNGAVRSCVGNPKEALSPYRPGQRAERNRVHLKSARMFRLRALKVDIQGCGMNKLDWRDREEVPTSEYHEEAWFIGITGGVSIVALVWQVFGLVFD
jgi:hypothetical protein